MGDKRSASVLNDTLLRRDYLMGNDFSVTDIIVGWSVNWGRRQGLLDDFAGLQAYLKRLFERSHCALAKD